ncbi:uracil-DNA glycosylase [uncultured Muribaculum sp.]|uniref:uracil-DNA glycosylase n=1 Tax=uncultured Muribaculum sp. TaxID=1918613 RepID=UPI0025F17F8F|nr:uracil-DNA glycosylase [uncultured Muribaculum sp.]
MNVRIDPSWRNELAEEWGKPYFLALTDFVRHEYRAGTASIYPPAGKIFAAFDSCPFNDVKVVILGQDPYHGPGQANGLCFSVNRGVALPPSLVNIFKEVKDDLGLAQTPVDGDLSRWARQGVLLLNSTLTVEAHRAASHQGRGWETFTDAVVHRLNDDRDGLVFILWGSYAIKKGAFIDRTRHLVIESAHPSPLSAYRGFFGSRPFSRANDYLVKHGKTPIDWK